MPAEENTSTAMPAQYIKSSDLQSKEKLGSVTDIELNQMHKQHLHSQNVCAAICALAAVAGFLCTAYAFATMSFVLPTGGVSPLGITAIVLLVVACVLIAVYFRFQNTVAMENDEIDRRARMKVSQLCPTVKPDNSILKMYSKVDIQPDAGAPAFFDIVNAVNNRDVEFYEIVDKLVESGDSYDDMSVEDQALMDKVRDGAKLDDGEARRYADIVGQAIANTNVVEIVEQMHELASEDDIASSEAEVVDVVEIEEAETPVVREYNVGSSACRTFNAVRPGCKVRHKHMMYRPKKQDSVQ